MIQVPTGFLWGSALSAHQSEGNNINSDSWLCERVTPTIYREPSGDACDSYHRYAEDIAICADLGLNTYRFGIEWARIEPEKGFFSQAELDHYRRMLDACHARGLTPMVTYSHFTVPRWFAAEGGFEEASSVDLFARFAEKSTAALGDLIGYAATFNEVNISRLLTQFMLTPQSREIIDASMKACAKACGSDRFSTFVLTPFGKTEPNMIAAHRAAKAAIKAGPGDIPVGLTMTMQDIQGVGEGNLAEPVIAALYGPWLEVAKEDDFVGVQTYTRMRVGPAGAIPLEPDAELTAAGYEFYPAALGGSVRLAHERIGVPIIVTENGVATDDDTRRIAYMDGALAALGQAIADGVDVRGFMQWSLLDNFEWMKGYGERFGIVHVDYETFARTPKPSAHHLGGIVRSGRFPAPAAAA